jgi:hypothetical protein
MVLTKLSPCFVKKSVNTAVSSNSEEDGWNPQGTRGGFWVGAMLTLAVKPQWVRNKLEETIEQFCSDFLAHTLEVCKSAHRYNEYSTI